MVVDLVSILIETAKGVYLIVAAICNRGIDKAGWALYKFENGSENSPQSVESFMNYLTKSSCNLGPIPIHTQSVLHGRIRH